MASYKDLLTAIRQGHSPREIIEQLRLNPTETQRLLGCKTLHRRLRMEEQISALIVSHETAAAAHLVARKLLELLDSSSAETTRKVCLALLNEAMHSDEQDGEPSAPANPAAALRRLTDSAGTSLTPPLVPQAARED
jgi:hypothetical protein